MFCSICGHPLPATATSCDICGSRAEFKGTSIPARSDEIPASKYAEHTSFAASAVQQKIQPSDSQGQTFELPYAPLVLSTLCLEVIVSIIAFNIADDFARRKWNSTPSTLVAIVLCALFFGWISKVWAKLKTGITRDDQLKQTKKLWLRIVIFGILFIATAVIVGTAIGTSGEQANQLTEHSREATLIATRISKARTSAASTVPAQIEMYKSIEPDVNAWYSALRKIRDELDVYDEKYPDQHADTLRAIQSIEIGQKRAKLLLQQIALAKEIASFDPGRQSHAWETQMHPLLAQEDSLDN